MGQIRSHRKIRFVEELITPLQLCKHYLC